MKDTARIQRFEPGRTAIERKRKPDGEQRAFQCDYLANGPGFALVRFELTRPGMFATPVPVPVGTSSYGYFWQHRPYNVYRFVDRSGHVLAHRFDAVGNVRITAREVQFDDLVLDWWALPGDILLEEDRDEFDALVASGTLDAAAIARVEEATRLIHARYRHIIDELDMLQHRLVSE